MFIKYDYTADGKPIMVEVTEEVAEFLREDKRLPKTLNGKNATTAPIALMRSNTKAARIITATRRSR